MGPEHAQIILNQVAKFDKNGNKTVSKEDIPEILRILSKNAADYQIRSFMRRYSDSEKQNTVTFDELLEIYEEFQQKSVSQDELLAEFKKFDKEGSKFITIEEIKAALTNFGESLPDTEVRQFANADGKINYEEFLWLELNKPVVIAVDVDETLVPFLKNLTNFHNKIHNPKIPMSEKDFWCYDFFKVWGMTVEEANEVVLEFFNSNDFTDLENPFPNAVENLKRMKEEYGFRFIIATARPSYLTEKTTNMIYKFFPGIFHSIIVCNSYWEGDKFTKYEVCRKMGCSALIDDSIKHVQSVAKGGLKGYLFGDYPWNRSDKLDPEWENLKQQGLVHCVADWNELFEKLTQEFGKKRQK